MFTAEDLHRRVVRLLELCWILALVFAPLYFDIFSSRIFEPDKIAIIRSLGLVAVASMLFDMALVRAKGRQLPTIANPIAITTGGLVLAYLASTIFSVAPTVSIFGSYQRLQGVYSLLSYIAIGTALFFYLREQVLLDRLLFFIISTSVPVSIYGIMQHFNLDPVGWKGDVSFRVSSTLGNPIFLAAYLIMVVPLAMSKLYWSILNLRSPSIGDAAFSWGRFVAVTLILLLQNVALYLALVGGLAALRAPQVPTGQLPPFGPWWLFPAATAAFVGSGWAVKKLAGEGRGWTIAYTVGSALALLLMLAAIFLSQSRGPWLGLGLGLFVWTVGLFIVERHRAWAIVTAIVGLLLVVFLIVFNLAGSPLAPLRQVPYVGRLGQLLETQTGTGKVRLLIWQGALHLAIADPMRTAVGYGPETMIYVFGRVYPPELGHYEARTAVPDRAHNALLDAQVNTGLMGLLAYLSLFGTLIAAGLRAVRVTPDRKSRVILLGILSALVAHFVEIQTGIQIATTWLYFFLFAGLLAVMAYGPALSQAVPIAADAARSRRTTRHNSIRPKVAQPLPRSLWAAAVVLIVIVGWLAWTTNLRLILADMYLQLGQGIAAGGRSDLAVVAYRSATEVAPEIGYYRFALASGAIDVARKATNQQEQERFFALARDALLEATKIEPLNSDHPANLSRLLRLWATSRGDEAMLREAVQWSERAVSLSPNNPQLWDELAIAHSLLAERQTPVGSETWLVHMQEAQRAFQRALRLDPAYALTYIYQGDYYYRPQSDARSGCLSYAEAAKIDPQALAADGRAEDRVAYCKGAGLLTAVADGLRQYLDAHPDSFSAANTMGFVMYQLGEVQEALVYFQMAAAIDPRDFNTHKNLAVVYSDTGKYTEAVRELELAVSLAPQDQAGPMRDLLSLLRSKAGQ